MAYTLRGTELAYGVARSASRFRASPSAFRAERPLFSVAHTVCIAGCTRRSRTTHRCCSRVVLGAPPVCTLPTRVHLSDSEIRAEIRPTLKSELKSETRRHISALIASNLKSVTKLDAMMLTLLCAFGVRFDVRRAAVVPAPHALCRYTAKSNTR
eukprot:3918817-Rhodomonas_salina.1